MDNTTLFERMGGDRFMKLLISSYFDELNESAEFSRYFKGVPLQALKAHQLKFFRLVLGAYKNQPTPEEVINYILITHTRLFRESGIDETHFDLVAQLFVQSLQSFQIDQDLIDECVEVLAPLREVFAYGAKVAKQEQEYTEEARRELPTCSASTVGSEVPAVLPEPPKADIPDWLPIAIAEVSPKTNVRAWSADLGSRFGFDGDEVVRDVLMDMPYLDFEPYVTNILQLAFLPETVEHEKKRSLIEALSHPRGKKHSKLGRDAFDRIVLCFGATCSDMKVGDRKKKALMEKMRTYRGEFSTRTKAIGGLDTPHELGKRKTAAIQVEGVPSEQAPNKDSTSVSGTTETSSKKSLRANMKPKKKKGIFGWARRLSIESGHKL